MKIDTHRPVQAMFLLVMGLIEACSPNSGKSRMPASTVMAASQSESTPVVLAQSDSLVAPHVVHSGPDALSSAPDSLMPAYRQFEKFLDLAIATRADVAGRLDSVYTRGTLLGIDERGLDRRWVAASRIVAVTTAGDSGLATAVITTVAHQAPEAQEGHFSVRFGIRDDTARWLLVRNIDTGGRWMVNGDGWMVSGTRESFGVFPLGSHLNWLTGTREQALAAVDSIRRARGLELVR